MSPPITPTSQLPKERLGFVSGNILVFALLFWKLWPAMTSYQTKLNLHAWTVNTPGQGVKPEYWIFWFGTLILATMAGALILAVLHILCWGIWLGISGEVVETTSSGNSKSETRIETILRGLCDRTYGAAFLLSIFLGPMTVVTGLVLVAVGLEEFLVTYLNFSLRLAGWIARMMMVLLFLAAWAMVFRFIWKRLIKSLVKSELNGIENKSKSTYEAATNAFTRGSFLLAFLIFLPLWPILTEGCYTLDLNTSKQLLSKKAEETLQIDVSLGGGTSFAGDADVKLTDATGSVLKKLNLEDLGDGRFLSYVETSELNPGRYQVVLDYPHTTLNQSFPYVSRINHKSRWFLVVP